MDQMLLSNEISIRLGFFFGVFILVGAWELIAPRRPLAVAKLGRWAANLGLVVLNSLLLRLLFPAAAVGFSAICAQEGWGLLNNISLSPWLGVAVAVVVLDFVIYLQHVLFHALPILWRLHRVHHADLDYDVTTGARFHPVEIILSMVVKIAAISVLGAPPVGVLIFEVVLNATAMFNHGNIYIPVKIDRIIRLCIVTPDMHRVHHCVEVDLTNSNFGFSLSIWDRTMGTYAEKPAEWHREMKIGLDHFRDPKQVNALPGILLLPFKKHLGRYPL
ncbi:MAG: sterol desaturase family protein [Magnetococcales bacterium]|nr:sterol desaturase family protein [Magnetococcales bacterium]